MAKLHTEWALTLTALVPYFSIAEVDMCGSSTLTKHPVCGGFTPKARAELGTISTKTEVRVAKWRV